MPVVADVIGAAAIYGNSGGRDKSYFFIGDVCDLNEHYLNRFCALRDKGKDLCLQADLAILPFYLVPE